MATEALTDICESVASAALTPYVPVILIEWLRASPDARCQEVDGTLAFVDISGFTTLTERLARKGKEGFEEISDTLDGLFTQLLDIGYEYGAEVVKWGGDAVLILFRGENHAGRAGRSAARMQRLIKRIGRLKTSRGTVVLRMSIGMHSGTFHFFLVGDLHRELVLTGPGAGETAAMQSIAEAGEIVVSAETARLLGPEQLGEQRGQGFLLAGMPGAVSQPPQVAPDTAGLPLERCFSAAIRDHLLAEWREPEHRLVTSAFVEFSGTSELIELAGPKAAADALDECLANVQAAAERHEVAFFDTDVYGAGGKILLVAGCPVSTGNNEERMLRTLRRALDGAGRLPVRAGVDRGRVFADDFGPPYRRTYSIKGDSVNLAARLMSRAGSGRLLATTHTVERSRASFAVKPVEPFMVKGKSAPISAALVGALAGGRAAAQERSGFVGRERELAVLGELLEHAAVGDGGLVELIGVQGIGKSRLVREFLVGASGTRVLAATGEEYESATPYLPFRDLLRGALRVEANEADLRSRVTSAAPELLPWLPLLAIPLGVDVRETPETATLDEKFRRSKLEEATSALLAEVLPSKTLFLFEDAHWLDQASAGLLERLALDAADRPWLILVTRLTEKPSPIGGDPAGTIELEGLAPTEAMSLLDAATEDQPLPPHRAKALLERAAGNPLYLEELIAATRELGEREELPDSLDAVITAQIDRLSAADRMLLRHAAVLGRTFDEQLLAASLAGTAPAPDESAWARLAPFLERDDGAVRFRQSVIRDTAYEGLPYRRRRELHGRAADALARTDASQTELLSLHFFHAQRFDEAWRYSNLAGLHAMSIYANVEAVAFLERALESARRLRTIDRAVVAQTSEALGDVSLRLGEFDRAASAYRAARRHADTGPVDEAKLFRKETVGPQRQGRYPQAIRWIRRGLKLLEGLDAPDAAAERARLYALYGGMRLRQGRHLETVEWCRRAIAEAEPVDAREALAQASYLLDYALVALGRYDEAVHSPRALAIYEESGDLDTLAGVLNNLGMFAYYRGGWHEAVEYYQRAEEAWERAGNRWAASLAMMNVAEILSDRGLLAEAEPLLKTALRITKASRSASRVAEICSYYGRLAARAGRFEQAHELLSAARQQFERDGARSELLYTDARLAEAMMLEGRHDEALALANESLRRAESVAGSFQAIPMVLRVQGSALLQAGRLEEAEGALEASLEGARERDADYEVGLALVALIALARASGRRVEPLEAERDAIFDRLGVVGVPDVPRAAASSPSRRGPSPTPSG